MNSRNSVKEKNLVNFPAEVSTLNKLDAKLSFPFDHIYACHSQSSDRRQPLQLEKEVEVSAHCVIGDEKSISTSPKEVNKLCAQLYTAQNHNKKLKDLLIYHLDLIQQQNELITKRDKLYQALKQENDNLKSKLSRMDKKGGFSERQTINPESGPTSTVTSATVNNEKNTSRVTINSLASLRPNVGKDLGLDKQEVTRETFGSALPPYIAGEGFNLSNIVPPISDPTAKPKMLETKRTNSKKESKTESPSESRLYTVTSSSGNPVIQRIQRNRRKTSTGIGSLCRMSRTPKAAIPATVTSQTINNQEESESCWKKSKTINTYGKSRTSTVTKPVTTYTGSLCDRLRLIDTTPTGDDPYQLGEADMREQSPIPKLMLQKTNHGRMKICDGTDGKKIYGSSPKKRFVSPYDEMKKETAPVARKQIPEHEPAAGPAAAAVPVPEPLPYANQTVIVSEPDLDLVKTEPEIDWRIYKSDIVDPMIFNDPNDKDDTNSLSPPLAMDMTDLQSDLENSLFENITVELERTGADNPADFGLEPEEKPRSTSNFSVSEYQFEEAMAPKRGKESRRGRKRASSATGASKAVPKVVKRKPSTRGRGGARGKRLTKEFPGMMTTVPYHTQCGDSNNSWYGYNPQLNLEDDLPANNEVLTVEVPRWREKPYTSSYTLEGTEDLADKVFMKRHQKLEAEERRQLRWHMRRIREQRHVERLRQRQRDSWCSQANIPSVYTVWPTPQTDVKFIEITETLPVMAFGEAVPDLPETEFMLPWVRTSKAQKRSKRSKTLL